MKAFKLTAVVSSPTLLIDDHITLWDEYGGVVSFSREEALEVLEKLRRVVQWR